MPRVLSRLALAVLLAVALAPVGPARADDAPACAPDSKSQVADITEHLQNFADVGVDGHVWALTDVDVRIQVWKLGTDHFCVRRDFHGTFRSYAGLSPNLTGTVSAGVTGMEEGHDWAVITGKWAPSVPLSGFVGDFDLGCTQDDVCALHRGPGSLFFADDIKALHGREFSLVYDGGDHGSGGSRATAARATSRAEPTGERMRSPRLGT